MQLNVYLPLLLPPLIVYSVCSILMRLPFRLFSPFTDSDSRTRVLSSICFDFYLNFSEFVCTRLPFDDLLSLLQRVPGVNMSGCDEARLCGAYVVIWPRLLPQLHQPS